MSTGSDIGLMFSRAVSGLDGGIFSMEFRPSLAYGSGGLFYLRLMQDPSNYYEIHNTDGFGPGVVRKVINDQVVETVAFQNGYSQGVNYPILVNFSAGYTKIIAFGEVFVFNINNSGITVNSFEIELIQQDGHIDNIRFAEDLSDSYVAMGDSITQGVTGDDILSDGIGYEPVLDGLLTAAKEYSHAVINRGVGGTNSSDGLSSLPSTLAAYPAARFYLIQYGTNDAWFPRPSGLGLQAGDPDYAGTYKDNMQQMITLVKNAAKEPYLAKVPIAFGSRSYLNPALQEYNQVVDELVSENKIGVIPPDFYTFFETHPLQMADDLHPNGLGYQSMAALWKDALIGLLP